MTGSAEPLAWVRPVVLDASPARLEPMAPGDAAGLAVAVVDGQLWRLNVASAPTPDRVSAYIEEALADRCRRPFTVFSAGRIVGTTSYYNILPQVARLEIGHTWYARSVQRTAVNTACKVALLDHAFGPLGARVVGWRTDLANTVSQRAIERLGALRDGVIRGDRLRKDGTIRDTVVYSMTAAEWAIHRARLVQ